MAADSNYNPLKEAVDRILGQPPGGASNATTAGTEPGTVQLAPPPPLWAQTGTQTGSVIGNTQPNYTPGPPPEVQRQLDDIRAQTAALQKQTTALGTPAAAKTSSLPQFDPNSLGVFYNADGSITRKYLGGTEPPPIDYSKAVGWGRTVTALPGGGQRVVDIGQPGVAPPPLPALPTTVTKTPTAGGGMRVVTTGQPGTIQPGANYGNVSPSPQMRLAAGPVPMMGYISKPGTTSRNPNAPSFATATNPSANPTGWLAATYAAHNAAYPYAPAPAPTSTFKLPTVQMHPGS